MRVFVEPTLTNNLRTWYTKPTLETDVTLPNTNWFWWIKNCRKLQRSGFRTTQTTGCCSASSLRNMRSRFHHHIASSFLFIELCHAISRNRGRSHKVPFRIGLLNYSYAYVIIISVGLTAVNVCPQLTLQVAVVTDDMKSINARSPW